MTRKTDELGLKAGMTNPYSMMKQFVFSADKTDALSRHA